MQMPLQIDTRCILQVKLQYLRRKDIHSLTEQDVICRSLLVLGLIHDISLNQVSHRGDVLYIDYSGPGVKKK